MTIRVFLVDDHAVIREGLTFILEAAGDLQVVGSAADGRSAVQAVRQLRPDVVLMDIALPELNGIDATRQIHQDCPDVEVVMLSAHADTEYAIRALRAGARGYLLKDTAGREVVAAVRAARAGQRYLSPRLADAVLEDLLALTPAASPLEALSDREREVLQLVAEGKSSAAIAERLALSPKTVDTYRSRIMQKLGLADLPALVRFAVRHGLVT